MASKLAPADRWAWHLQGSWPHRTGVHPSAQIPELDFPGSCTFNNGIGEAPFSALGWRQQYPYTHTYGVPLTHPETPVQHQPTCVLARTSSGCDARVAQGAG